jgi:hypothetical protein
MKSALTSTIAILSLTQTNAFAPSPLKATTTTIIATKHNHKSTQLYGLFDGIKDAFVAPALERSTLDAERETPIDRWMGWNVKSTDSPSIAQAPENFVDSMAAENYIATKLTKPMGIVFEENDEEFGGIFVLSLSEGGAAEKDGKIKPGDQLVAVNQKKVSGFSFDDALGAIIDSSEEQTQLIFFRGSDKQLYGPTGASKDWLDEFIANPPASIF